MQIGFLVRRTAALTPRWTTTHWIAAASTMGHTVWVFDDRDLLLDQGRWTARCYRLRRAVTPAEVGSYLGATTARRRRVRVEGLDLLLLRASPDPSLLALALTLQEAGIRVVNAPAGILAVSHKSWLASQRDLPTPPTVVTSRIGDAHAAHQAWGDVVVKPDRGSGGRAVNRVRAGDHEALDTAFHEAIASGGRVIVQPLLDGSGGEKRLLWCDGEIVGGYVRHAAPGEFRHNMKRGARAAPITLGRADRALGPLLAPKLLPLGVRFVGLDLLGDSLVEVNAANPGGTVYADALHGTQLADSVVRRLVQS